MEKGCNFVGVIKKNKFMKPFRVKIITDNDTFYSYRCSYKSCMDYVSRCMCNVYPCYQGCNVSYHVERLDDNLNYQTVCFTTFVQY